MTADGAVTAGVHLLVPIKPLHVAKSRLLGAADRGLGHPDAHAGLVKAVAFDTVSAARRALGVRAVVVVTSDPELTDSFTSRGVRVLPDSPAAGLNEALDHGDRMLRGRDPVARVGALQADLPALRSAELTAALRLAGTARAFCPDRQGTGTTLLLAEPGRALDPGFGPGSAARHRDGGARRLDGPWASVRCDVDTAEDLRAAAELGLGPHTREYPVKPAGTPDTSRDGSDRTRGGVANPPGQGCSTSSAECARMDP